MAASVLVASAEGIHRGLFLILILRAAVCHDGQILLLHLPQFIFPRNSVALDALYCELAAQSRFRIRRPDHLAHGFVAPALDRYQVPNFHVAEAKQTRAAGMNIVGTRNLLAAASAARQMSEANWQSQ